MRTLLFLSASAWTWDAHQSTTLIAALKSMDDFPVAASVMLDSAAKGLLCIIAVECAFLELSASMAARHEAKEARLTDNGTTRTS
jgi:hypothetical protein